MSGLQRFVDAQSGTFDRALDELRGGAKHSHWMWFVFPQIAGLGTSETARFYAIADLAEAKAYLAHPLLGPRLRQCTQAALGWAGTRSARDIFGSVDALKLRSSMTLFEAAGGGTLYSEALDRFYEGARDNRTLAFLHQGE